MTIQEKESLAAVQSWNSEEQFYELTAWHRNNQMVTGVVRSIIEQPYRAVGDDGVTKVIKAQILIIALPNGTTGYCSVDNFLIREFKNYRQFVGRKAHFFVEQILLDENKLILNGKRAQEQRIGQFWQELLEYDEAGTLEEHTYKGIVTGQNPTNRAVFVNIEGQDCYMPRIEWSWNERDALYVSEGEEIDVRITRIDKENNRITVSRRRTLPDPYVFLQSLKVGDVIAGKVSMVHPKDGIFVQLESGLDVKAGKLRALEEPIVGDMVSCRIIKEITPADKGRISGRVVIIKYPNGKRKRKDLGTFLFE